MSGIEILAHPPHSPDFVSCDFHLFPKINKKKLHGKWVTDAEDAVAACETAVEATPKYEPSKCFSQWFHRMQRLPQFAVDDIELPFNKISIVTALGVGVNRSHAVQVRLFPEQFGSVRFRSADVDREPSAIGAEATNEKFIAHFPLAVEESRFATHAYVADPAYCEYLTNIAIVDICPCADSGKEKSYSNIRFSVYD
ncbi:hypothetical protein EVAR_63282_1 [Eumeta japonica]|uniref:Histone-lysine N-methyltransferase SETMAR n=1 Tax=Eumeta variegata TaxID=151549 RepID=A0A4C1ZWK3_EUMVA|nr:hypothetical protein EVAR_63282_1 [Eumeta japonica]